MQGAWNVARFQASKSGKPAREHFAEALKTAWHVARRQAEEPKAAKATEYNSMGYRVDMAHVPAAFVAEVVSAMGACVEHVGARSITVKGGRDTRFDVSPFVRRAQAMFVQGVQAGMQDGTVRYASKADLRRQAAVEAEAAKAARAATPKWQERIVVGVSAMNPDNAPATIEREGRTLSLTGYGKVWSHYDSSDCSVYGVHPSYDRVRYAYYA